MSDRITTAEVVHVARVWRASASRPEEIERTTVQLGAMLDHFADIDGLDLADVEPMTQPYPLTNVLPRRRGRAGAGSRTRCWPPPPTPSTTAFRVPPIIGLEGDGTAVEGSPQLSGPASGRHARSSRSTSPRSTRRGGRAPRLQHRARDEARRRRRRPSTQAVAAGRRPRVRWRACRWRSRTTSARWAADDVLVERCSRLPPPYDATCSSGSRGRRSLSARRTSTSSPWVSTENSAFRPRATPGTSTASRRLHRRLRGGVAAGMSALGSARTPAAPSASPPALCGVVGSSPPTAVSAATASSPSPAPSTRSGRSRHTVADARWSLNTISGHDPSDATSAPADAARFTCEPRRAPEGPPHRPCSANTCREGLDPRVRDARSRPRSTRAERARCEDRSTSSLPRTTYALAAYYVIAAVPRRRAISRATTASTTGIATRSGTTSS